MFGPSKQVAPVVSGAAGQRESRYRDGNVADRRRGWSGRVLVESPSDAQGIGAADNQKGSGMRANCAVGDHINDRANSLRLKFDHVHDPILPGGR